MKTLKKEKFIVDAKGRKKAVVLDIRDYEEMLEDIAERENEPTRPLEEVEKRLKKLGLL